MKHSVALTLTGASVAFTLKNIFAFTLNIPMHPLETCTARHTIVKSPAHICAGLLITINSIVY